MDKKLNFTYNQEELKLGKICLIIYGIWELIFFFGAVYFSVTFVDKETSGDAYIGMWMLFFVLMPGVLCLVRYYHAIKSWQFNFDGKYITYCPMHGKSKKLQLKEISCIQITKNKKIIIRNQYHEVFLKERLLKMPGVVEVLQVMQANEVKIEFQPGTDKIKNDILYYVNGLNEYEQNGKKLYPWPTEAMKYVDEPVSEKRIAIEKKRKIYTRVSKILYYVILILVCIFLRMFNQGYMILFWCGIF